MKKIVLLVLVAQILLLSGCSENSKNYKNAKELMDSGAYQEAIAVFNALDDYKEAEKLAIECEFLLAEERVESGEYELAINRLTELEKTLSEDDAKTCRVKIIESYFRPCLKIGNTPKQRVFFP